MLGTLQDCTEQELINFVALILSRPGDLTAFDHTELAQINHEFQRRNSLPYKEIMAESLTEWERRTRG